MRTAILLGLGAGLLATELALQLAQHSFLRGRLNKLVRAALNFSEATEDTDKQRWVLSAGINLLAAMLWLMAILFALGAVVYVPTEWFNWSEAQEDVFLYATGLASVPYAWLRTRSWSVNLGAAPTPAAAESGSLALARYGLLARLLHWIALEPSLIRRTSFELERVVFGKRARSLQQTHQNGQGPVYVCGLARSGTTIVLEILNDTGEFSSPTYRDMPFVLAPNLWGLISGVSRQNAEKSLRAHGDGIAISPDSPESFEEVFWRSFCQPLQNRGMGYESPDDETLQLFADYRALCVLSRKRQTQNNGGARYLSKNNNNLLRLPELLKDSNAQVVLVFRNPLATAWSLYQQHQRFSRLQDDDPFARAYMRWLGHHEFGDGHLPFAFASDALKGLMPDQPDYWLVYWMACYQHILPIAQSPQVALLCHDALSEQPQAALAVLFKNLCVNAKPKEFAGYIKPSSGVQHEQDLIACFSPTIVQHAGDLYKTMLDQTRLSLNL